MCALPSARGPGAPLPLPLLLLVLVAAHPCVADENPPDSPFTFQPATEEMMAKYSNLSSESHNISLTEHSSVPIEKNITLEKPSNIALTCLYTTSGDLSLVNVTWKKDNELLENNSFTNATGASYIPNTLPEIHGKNKPLITYVGDATVLTCKCHDCVPLNWTWYSSNGSVQVPVDVQMNDKYVINGTYANETKLKIMQLSEEDKGSYWCHAIFQLGESEDHIELVVLSYLVPLKPFLAIAAEVVLLVAIILLCEIYTQKKNKHIEDEKEFEQIEQLKSEDSNGIENSVPRHRKN